MYFDCVMAGFGGQGILSAGMILAHMAVSQDLNVTWFPSYGAEQRGGTANCTVVISDEEIGSPVIPNPKYGFIMNYPSMVKFKPRFEKGGGVVVDTSLVDKKECDRSDIKFYGINASEIAQQIGNIKIANMVMIGALLKISGLFTLETANEALVHAIPKKYHNMLDINRQALKEGFELVGEL